MNKSVFKLFFFKRKLVLRLWLSKLKLCPNVLFSIFTYKKYAFKTYRNENSHLKMRNHTKSYYLIKKTTG